MVPIYSISYNDSVVPPKLHIQGSSNAPDELDTLIIECSVMANPPANITWLFRTPDGVKNVLTSSRRSISHSFDTNGSNGPVSRSILVVRDVVQTDSGMYNCETTNDVFTETVSVNISVSVIGEFTSRIML